MNATQRRKSLFENVARLRRVERKTPSQELAKVREDLQEELGETVSKNLAAQLLGVSHTALGRWIDAGDVPVVFTREGRKEVPVSELLDLFERVADERNAGRRKLHTLEPVMSEGRARAERMRPDAVLSGNSEGRDRHRISQLRGLAYHRAIAPRLRRPMIEEARRQIDRWERDERIHPRYAKAWREVLNQPISGIRKKISADTEDADDLRQNSPFTGLLSEPERRKILEKVR